MGGYELIGMMEALFKRRMNGRIYKHMFFPTVKYCCLLQLGDLTGLSGKSPTSAATRQPYAQFFIWLSAR